MKLTSTLVTLAALSAATMIAVAGCTSNGSDQEPTATSTTSTTNTTVKPVAKPIIRPVVKPTARPVVKKVTIAKPIKPAAKVVPVVKKVKKAKKAPQRAFCPRERALVNANTGRLIKCRTEAEQRFSQQWAAEQVEFDNCKTSGGRWNIKQQWCDHAPDRYTTKKPGVKLNPCPVGTGYWTRSPEAECPTD